MKESIKADLLEEEKVLVEMPKTLYTCIMDENNLHNSFYNNNFLYEYRKLINKCDGYYDINTLKRYGVLYSNRESEDSIKLDYKTLKKSKGQYDIRTLDFKIADIDKLDQLNLFYINGRLCGWKKSKTGGKEIVEIKSEDDLMDYNKYDKRFKTIWIVVRAIFAVIVVLACIADYIN